MEEKKNWMGHYTLTLNKQRGIVTCYRDFSEEILKNSIIKYIIS